MPIGDYRTCPYGSNISVHLPDLEKYILQPNSTDSESTTSSSVQNSLRTPEISIDYGFIISIHELLGCTDYAKVDQPPQAQLVSYQRDDL